MLKITTVVNGKTKVSNILVIDAHSHMGKDVDGHEMMNPMQAGQGTFDFWGRIEHLILKDWENPPHITRLLKEFQQKFH